MTTTKTTATKNATATHVAADLPVRQSAAESSTAAPQAHRLRPFLRHLAEMVVAMFAGMLLLDQIWEAVFTALGAATVLAQPEVSAAVMATDMTVGMSVWMVHRRHSPAAIAEMGAAMYLSFLLAFVPYWLGLLAADTALMIGHVLMVPAMVGAMLLRRDEYVHGHRPVAQSESDRSSRTRRVVEFLGHRWPTVLALLVTFDSWFHPGVTPVWLLVGIGAEYLVIGSLQRRLGDPRLLALQVAGFLAYVGLALLALSVDAETARYVIAAGWLLHTVWDAVLYRANKVVWRPWAEACAVVDLVFGLSILFLLP